ncbi:MAG: sulfatase-like hydrolase/transferase [Acidobacteriota bacterium]
MAVAGLGLPGIWAGVTPTARPPNILLATADDWFWPHATWAGCNYVQTPNFDRMATEGVVFTHADVASPTCSPSRASLLTRQWPWRLQEGANLGVVCCPNMRFTPICLRRPVTLSGIRVSLGAGGLERVRARSKSCGTRI